MKNVFLKNIVFLIIIFIVCKANAQDIELWYKLSPEIRLSFEKNNWEFRLRPTDYVIPHNVSRTDIMIGRKINKFRIFSYSKFDTDKRYWTGIRLDFNQMGFDKKALFHLQTRYFLGLNSNSEDHFYFIQLFNYEFNKIFGLGFLGYCKTNFKETPYWFMGPSTIINFTKNFGLHLAYTKDIYRDKLYMTFIRLNCKFKI